MENCVRAIQATDDSIIWCIRFTCWIAKVADTHTEYIYLLLFHANNGYTHMPQCYILLTLPFLLYFSLHES